MADDRVIGFAPGPAVGYLVAAMAVTRWVYLDHNATTAVHPRVADAVALCLREGWGNPSSRHRVGGQAASRLRKARREVAGLLGFSPSEVIFTSGGTESDALALRGVLLASDPPRHLVVSAIEHPAVLESAHALQDEGVCAVTVVGVDEMGRVDPQAIEDALRPDTRLVSVMSANNETGVIQPVVEIARRVRTRGVPFHSDMVQSVGKMPLEDVAAAVDLLSISAHKFAGPKGAGALLVRRGVPLRPVTAAGGQEGGRRGGTENVAGAVGLAQALRITLEEAPAAIERMRSLRDRLEEGLLERVDDLQITSREAPRVANTTHLTLGGVESGALLTLLDEAGIAVSAGSACATGALKPSHVLVAQGTAPERLHGALRLSLGPSTRPAEIERVLKILPALVDRLRRLQPGKEPLR